MDIRDLPPLTASSEVRWDPLLRTTPSSRRPGRTARTARPLQRIRSSRRGPGRPPRYPLSTTRSWPSRTGPPPFTREASDPLTGVPFQGPRRGRLLLQRPRRLVRRTAAVACPAGDRRLDRPRGRTEARCSMRKSPPRGGSSARTTAESAVCRSRHAGPSRSALCRAGTFWTFHRCTQSSATNWLELYRDVIRRFDGLFASRRRMSRRSSA
jgi:hypothetical protein